MRELFSLRDLRNAALGTGVVIGGLALAGLTLYAHQSGNIRLAGISAAASLIFVLVILIFIVPPLARNAGREASQLNLPFEFTTGGAIMLVLVVIVGFSAWNTGNNLLFIVLSFLLAAMVVGFFAGSFTLKKLDIKMRFPDTIFAGERTPILVSLTNRKKLLPAFSVVAEVRGKERERSIAADDLESILPAWIAKKLSRAPVLRRTLEHFVYLPRNSTAEVRTEHIFPNRGRLMIRDFELSTKFPFGFFRHRRRLPAKAAEIVILPKIERSDLDLEHMPTASGDRASGKRGLGLDLLALRNYQPQDDLRHVDWKATARSRNLTVREYASDDELTVSVYFDPRIPKTGDVTAGIRERLAVEQSGKPVVVSERFEKGTTAVASVLSDLATENATFRLVIDDNAGEFSSGRGHLYDSLRRIAQLDPVFIPENTASEPDPSFLRILNDAEDGHHLLVTAASRDRLPLKTLQKLKIIDF